MPNEFDTAVESALGGFKPAAETAQAARLGMSQAVGTNPDLYAELSRVAQKTGVPMTTALNMPDEVKRQAQLGSIDFDQLAATSPATARLLGNMDRAKVVHDDVGNLSGLEGLLQEAGSAITASAKYITSAPGQRNTLLGDAGAGVLMANTGAAGVFRAMAENTAPLLEPLVGGILPENPMLRVAAGFAKMGADTERTAKQISPPQSGIVAGGVSSGVQSFVQNALTLPMALLPGGAMAALGGMSLQQGGNAYNDARDAGVSPQRAGIHLATQAGLEAAFEMGPLMQLVKDVKAGTPLFKTLLTNIALEVPNEVATTLLQNADTWATINPNKSAGDFLREQPAAIAQTVIATMIGAGGNTMLMHTVQGIADTASGTERKAQQAEQTAGILQKLVEFSSASKVRERDAGTFEAFMQDATLDSPLEKVYVSPKDLQAAGLDLTQLAELAPSLTATPELQQALQVAIESGQDIGIPTAELLTRLPGSEFEQSLIPHLKTEAGGFSQLGAQTYMQEQGAETQALVEKVLGEKQMDEGFKASADVVEQRVLAQLTTANRFTEDVNKPYAALWKAFFAVQAARTGTTPEAMFDKYSPKIVAEGAGGYEQSDKTILVTSLDGLISPNATAKEGATLYAESLQGTAVDHAQLGRVAFTSEAKGKIFADKRSNALRASVVKVLPQLIRNSHVVGAALDEKGRADVGGFTYAVAPMSFDGQMYAVELKFKRTEQGGTKLYTFDGYKMRAVNAMLGLDSSAAAGGNPGSSPPAGLSLSHILSEIEARNRFFQDEADAPRSAARGSFNPSTMTTTLLKAANLSTFLHESGHFFLEVQFDLAAQISQAASVFGAETSQAGEQQILQDSNAILSWMGVRDLTEWGGAEL